MSLRDRAKKRFTASVADLDKARLQDRYAGLDITNFCDITMRTPSRFGGEVSPKPETSAGKDPGTPS